MEDSNTLSGFVNKVIGSLPVVGLIARILSDEGGLGGDTIDFAEFRRRVGNKCSVNDSRAFIEFKDRRGRVIIFLSSGILVFRLLGYKVCLYTGKSVYFFMLNYLLQFVCFC